MSRDPLHTRLCDDLGIEVPIFGFSHCKDVVVELCNAGGVGIFGGIVAQTSDELAAEIKWIQERIGSRPFGVDLIFPATMPEKNITMGEMKTVRQTVFDLIDEAQETIDRMGMMAPA